MAQEKQYTAKQAAQVVLEKVGELLQKSELSKAEPTPWKGPNSSSKGVNAPLPTNRKVMENPERRHGESDAGVAVRTGMKGAAKQFHHETLDELRSMKSPNLPKSEDTSLDKKYEGFKAVEESAKESGAKDPAAVAAAAGRKKYGKAAFQAAAAAGKKMGKAENPDEKADAELGEKVEHDVEEHMKENRAAEEKEGHLKCSKCGEEMKKGESKHDRCVEHVKENSPEVKNPHAVCVAEGVKPAAWGKSEEMQKAERPTKEDTTKLKPAKPAQENDDQNAENEHPQGKAPKGEIHPKEHVEGASDDVREQPAPGNNPKEEAEGNNELAGTTPTQVGQDGKNKPGYDEMKSTLKLAKFIGRMEHKRKSRQ